MEARHADIIFLIEQRTAEAHKKGRYTWTAKEAKEIASLQNEAAELLKQIHEVKRNN